MRYAICCASVLLPDPLLPMITTLDPKVMIAGGGYAATRWAAMI
jgi:hypothetical protein